MQRFCHQGAGRPHRADQPEGLVVFTGDTGPSENLVKLAQGADVLVSEVLNLEALKQMAPKAFKPKYNHNVDKLTSHMLNEHLTPANVGKLAYKAKVDTVILYHVVPGKAPQKDVIHFAAGVKQYFSGTVILGQDLFQYSLFGIAGK